MVKISDENSDKRNKYMSQCKIICAYLRSLNWFQPDTLSDQDIGIKCFRKKDLISIRKKKEDITRFELQTHKAKLK